MDSGALANIEVGDVKPLEVVHRWAPEISGPRREYMEEERECGLQVSPSVASVASVDAGLQKS